MTSAENKPQTGQEIAEGLYYKNTYNMMRVANIPEFLLKLNNDIFESKGIHDTARDKETIDLNRTDYFTKTTLTGKRGRRIVILGIESRVSRVEIEGSPKYKYSLSIECQTGKKGIFQREPEWGLKTIEILVDNPDTGPEWKDPEKVKKAFDIVLTGQKIQANLK